MGAVGKLKYLGNWGKGFCFFVLLITSMAANAGHLFTQSNVNTPVSLEAGQQITVKQKTYEAGGGSNGRVTVNFSGGADDTAWSAGDALSITIGAWSNTFTYDTLVAAGGSQSSSLFSITDATLAAAGLTPAGEIDWVVNATSGKFTFTGYRIYTAGNTLNGTGAGQIDQTQVVVAPPPVVEAPPPVVAPPPPVVVVPPTLVPAARPQEVGIAQVLDNLYGTATGQMQAVLTALTAMTQDSQQLALKLISPESSQVLGQSAVSTAAIAIDTVQVRLDSLRSGLGLRSNPAQGSNVSFNGHHGETGISAGNDAMDRSFWVKAFGGNANQDAKGGFAGADSNIYGMMFGHDKGLANGALVGASLAYAKTDASLSDFRTGDSAKVDTYQLTGYFSRPFERWYLEGMLAYAAQNYETTRNTNLTGVATGDFDGNLYAMRMTAGVPFKLNEILTLTPYVGVDAYRVTQSGYTENGAGVLSLSVSGNDANRVRSLAGTELTMLKKLNDGSVLRPSIRLNWRHEFKNEGVNTNASLVGGGAQFEATGQEINKNVYGLSGRLNWEKTDQLTLGLELGAERGSGYRSLVGQFYGNWRF
ncbi:MAG: hypothetical protein A3I66_18070 [Burkholderiales bacterium RIFCSPLOWO2_02_FULL_57_36]|nr:MAG: hypothetical protein A3I66_18070 [Burkholderiales bacterium RIFCSPLOWO2_02_FULL_57_36]